MARLPKIPYLLVPLILVIALTGCELSRDSDDISNASAVSDLPPTLAPLGAEPDLAVEAATPIPTIINVQPTATQSSLDAGQAAENPNEIIIPTSQAVELSDAGIVSSEAVAVASATGAENAENFVPPAEQAVTTEVVAQEAIVVNATTSDDLPIGGPVAANPPASQTTGSYDASVSGYNDGTYTVQQGDTLFSIALRYNTSVGALIAANRLPSDVIYAGQELNISGVDSGYTEPFYQPPAIYDNTGQGKHVVVAGDTLFSLALRYGTSVDAIAGANGIPYPYYIQAGQTLLIPAPGDYYTPPPPPAGFYEQPYYEQEPSYPQYPAQTETYQPVPGNVGTHTVAPGETLYSIAVGYGTTAEALAIANGLYNPNEIYVGQVLFLP